MPNKYINPIDVSAIKNNRGQSAKLVVKIDHPQILVVDDFLSDLECFLMIEQVKDKMEISQVVDVNTGEAVKHDNRTSSGSWIHRGANQFVESIERRIAHLLNYPYVNGEMLQIMRYEANQYYRPHFDYFIEDQAGTPVHLKRGGQRVATFIMYLNTPIKGGSTNFPDAGIEVFPKMGRALLFAYDSPSPETKTIHSGEPVIEGEKWIATKWLRQGEFT